MTDDSKFEIRWPIDNAKERITKEKFESGVFTKWGFNWIASIEPYDFNDHLTLGLPCRGPGPHEQGLFTLKCDADHCGTWNCDVELYADVIFHKECRGVMEEWGITGVDVPRVRFDKTKNLWFHVFWFDFLNNILVENCWGSMVIKMLRSVNNSPIADPDKFSAPDDMSNVILKIEDKKIHVSKEYLSIHSPVFKAMFYGNYSENGKEEIELKDVVHEEFIDLLNLIYPGTMKITDRTVVHILKLADRFQLEHLVDQSKEHLILSKGIDPVTKILTAEQYCFAEGLILYASDKDLVNIKASPEFANFSDDTKAAIFYRIDKDSTPVN